MSIKQAELIINDSYVLTFPAFFWRWGGGGCGEKQKLFTLRLCELPKLEEASFREKRETALEITGCKMKRQPGALQVEITAVQ